MGNDGWFCNEDENAAMSVSHLLLEVEKWAHFLLGQIGIKFKVNITRSLDQEGDSNGLKV
jgi:hypothetical protein